MRVIFLHIIFIFLLQEMVVGQFNNNQDSNLVTLPPLVDILNAAIKHSPLLKAKSMDIAANRESISIAKKQWSDYIFIEGAANYGLYDQVVVNGISTDGTSNTGALTKAQQMRYYGGVGLKLPLSALGSRKNEVKITRLQVEKASQEYQQIIKDIKQLIIEEYYQLLYLKESLQTFQGIYQTLDISLKKSERDVLNGRMNINDYALLVSTVGKAQDDYNKARNSFYAQYHKLQNISGVVFESL